MWFESSSNFRRSNRDASDAFVTWSRSCQNRNQPSALARLRCPALPSSPLFSSQARVPMPHSLRQHLCARSYIKALEDGMTARRANRIISRRTKIQRLAKYASSCYTRWTRYAPFHAFLGIYSHRLFDLAPNTNTRCRSHSRLPSKWTSAAFDACSLSELPASLPHLHPVNPEPHIPNSHARESPSTYISPVRGSYNACTLRPRSHRVQMFPILS